MTQKTSSQFLPASAVSALNETTKCERQPSYKLDTCLLPISQVTDTHYYVKIAQRYFP